MYFNRVTGFHVEELAVDLSSKRKNFFKDYCNFCDVTYMSIMKYVSTRWLSLATAVERALKVYSYEEESQARFKRLKVLFSSPMTEIYLFFYQSVLIMFLQRDPCIHLVHNLCMDRLQKVLGKFIKVQDPLWTLFLG